MGKHRPRVGPIVCALSVLLGASPALAQQCSREANERADAGYAALRANDLGGARAAFEAALQLCAAQLDARTGLGYTLLRSDSVAAAVRHFDQVLAVRPDHTDALVGRASAAWRQGETTRAAELYERVLRDHPQHGDALDFFRRAELRETAPRLSKARALAWGGNYRASLALLDSLLAAAPTDREVLEARAQIASWAGRYDESLASYLSLLEARPGDAELMRQRARVFGWATQFRAASAAYDTLLRRNPNDREALRGLAQVLSWSNRLDSAETIYHKLVALDAGDRDAQRGLARIAAWNGRLKLAEQRWRTLAADTTDVAALAGLAATLRWQGRDAAAREQLERALAIAPGHADAARELRWVNATVAPRAGATLVFESDSDDNDIMTVTATSQLRPAPRLAVRADLYRRAPTLGALAEHSLGGTIGAWLQLEPGWTVSGAAGLSRVLERSIPALRAALQSPQRESVQFSASLNRAALDMTVPLVRNQVAVTELSASVAVVPNGRWRGGAGAFTTAYDGPSQNRSIGANAYLLRSLGRLRLGLNGRTFSFDSDLDDGYFDPDFFGIAELVTAWSRERGRWTFTIDAVPGIQRVRSDDPAGSFRGAAGLAYSLAPGRQIALHGILANAGVHQLSGASGSDYRYRSISLSVAWSFY